MGETDRGSGKQTDCESPGDVAHDGTYRSKEELQAIKEFDPVPNFRTRLLEDGVLTEEIDNQYEDEIKQMVNHAHRTAEAAPYPDPAEHLSAHHTFAPDSQGDF